MARPKQRPRTNRYSAEFKLEAVKLSHMEGVQVRDVAEALDIHPYMLSRWRSEARKGLIPPPPSTAAKTRRKKQVSELTKFKRQRAANERELGRYVDLKRDHQLLKQEHELLKKAIRFTSARNRTSSPSSSRKRTASG